MKFSQLPLVRNMLLVFTLTFLGQVVTTFFTADIFALLAFFFAELLALLYFWVVTNGTIVPAKVENMTLENNRTVSNFKPKRFIVSILLIIFILTNSFSCTLAIAGTSTSERIIENYARLAAPLNIILLVIMLIVVIFLWGLGVFDKEK